MGSLTDYLEFKNGKMEQIIDFKLKDKAEIITNKNTSNNDFMDSLIDLCTLNQLKDVIEKGENK